MTISYLSWRMIRHVAYLLSGDAHVVSDVREDRWLDEEALLAPGASSTLQFGPFPPPALNQLQDLIKLLLVNLARDREALSQRSTQMF